MYECRTNYRKSEEEKKVQSQKEARDSEGVGAIWKRDSSGRKVSGPSSHSIPLEKGIGARSRYYSQREETQDRSPNKELREREPIPQGGPCIPEPGAYAFKKRDELGLGNRNKGQHLSQGQQERIMEEVLKLKGKGISKSQAFSQLGVCRSTYYGWLEPLETKMRNSPPNRLLPAEREAVVHLKRKEPYLSHRKISGLLREDNLFVSPSSCYRILKSLGWIEPQHLRESPWKKPRYEPFRANQIWGEDWTQLVIDGLRYYLLTIIDYFSRFIIAWGIVKTVTKKEVQDLVVLAYLIEGIEKNDLKPKIRLDQGSPNMAYGTRGLIKDLEMVFSPSRVNRPTDNARQERFYRTLKQEEIYCYPSYPSVEIARKSIGEHIEFYNERRPHQALWNFAPGYVHRLGNKTELLKEYKRKVQIVKERRLTLNRAQMKS